MLNFKTLVFAGVVVCIAGMSGNVAFAMLCDPNANEPDFYVYGLCFAPYSRCEGPGDSVDMEQITERLNFIGTHTQWVRTYGATNGLEDIPQVAHSLGLSVAMGTWIRDNREQEINNLVAAAQAGYVDIAVVGNEEMIAGAMGANELVSVINDVRQQLEDANCPNTPIAIAEPFGTWANKQPGNIFERDPNDDLKHRQVFEAVDIMFLNIYPFFEGVHIDNAEAKLQQMYLEAVSAVHEVDPNIEVFISETGWPSEGLKNGDAKPTLANAARYFFESSAWSADHNVPIFYFEAFDENWKENPCNPTVYMAESHWGIWDICGDRKRTFLPERVFCETFDPPVNSFCPLRDWESSAPDANVQPGDANSEGQYLRILYDGTKRTHLSRAAFDNVAPGKYPLIEAKFDFRFNLPGTSTNADGFAFMLIPTSRDGQSGCSIYSDFNFFAEQPKLSKTFAVGFEVYDYENQRPCDKVYVSWDKKWFPEGEPIDVSIDLDSGKFHRATIRIRKSGNDSFVTVILAPNVYDPNEGKPVTIVRDIRIEDLRPYENRVEFVGRNGGLDVDVDIDNIYVVYKPEICEYMLAGDTNEDCKVNFYDFAMMAGNWLIDCDSTGSNPACVAK